MTKPDDKQSTSLKDVKQLGLIAAIASLGYVFWVVGAMEMVERLAYYGVKAVAAIYATEAQSDGGLGVTEARFGVLLMFWAFVQTFLPVITGGLTDRLGYKETIFLSTIVKIAGYVVMALDNSYWVFFAGAMILAAGTAIFKPGIQATLVKCTNRQNSSMAWGIFYQTVNVGGFLGPIVAAYMRSNFSWTMVFVACVCIISCNFILLLTYREVGKEERLERKKAIKAGKIEQKNLFVESIRELMKPHVFVYLIIFSGFWFMFNSLFDVLPLHIRDWVDRTDIVATIASDGQVDNGFLRFLLGMNADGTDINPEGLLNLNAGMIMITCFLFAYVSGLMRATTSMLVGTLFASGALFAAGNSAAGWVMAGSIALFSIGEMLSSPKFSEFMGNFAPHDKKAMYLGFSQIPLGIGWTLEGLLGPMLYGIYASKDKFSRELLEEKMEAGAASLDTYHESFDERLAEIQADEELASEDKEKLLEDMKAPTEDLAEKADKSVDQIRELENSPDEFVDAIPQGEAFDWLVGMSGESSQSLTAAMYAEHNVAVVWYIMGAVGIVSAIGIYAYGKWILTLKTDSE